MDSPRTFRLFNGAHEARFEVVSEHRWRVLRASEATGLRTGDEVAPVPKISWRQARRRVNSRRTALSPNRLVLLRGEGFERSESEIAALLRIRPWDPDVPPAA
ncbi:MAG TPA: hypothetical protein VNO22_18730 [Planctomycetota bacterium]|nr:hypothetical protein [Planctomycetota bacterium]